MDYDKLEKAAEEIRVVYTRRYGLGYPEAHVLADAIPELIEHARVQDEDILALAAQMSADMDSDAQKRAIEYEKKMWKAEHACDELRVLLSEAISCCVTTIDRPSQPLFNRCEWCEVESDSDASPNHSVDCVVTRGQAALAKHNTHATTSPNESET